MKLVLAWLSTLVLGAIVATSCSINHRSDDYACTKQSDCDPGRLCIAGLCVLSDTPVDGRTVDAAPQPDAGDQCPAQCTTCNATTKECTINCAVTDCTSSEIVCPTGWNCILGCNTANACSKGVDCSGAKSCTFSCTGPGSCQSIDCQNTPSCVATCSGQNSCRGVVCTSGSCDLTCQGQGACRNIDCDQACACDVRCGAGTDCSLLSCPANTLSGLMCRGAVNSRGCTSEPAGCDTCP